MDSWFKGRESGDRGEKKSTQTILQLVCRWKKLFLKIKSHHRWEGECRAIKVTTSEPGSNMSPSTDKATRPSMRVVGWVS